MAITTSLEERFVDACKEDIAGAILLAEDVTGKFKYEKAIGARTAINGSQISMGQDAVLMLASCTKLVTSIAALQCVERGLLKLDEDVSGVLPELGSVEILGGVDASGEKVVLKPKSGTITLAHLLTHSSGLRYDLMDPNIMKWQAGVGKKPMSGVSIEERFGYPLGFEPGTAWGYGAGIDWAGKMIERVTGEKLEDYMRDNIWVPLGVTEMTFWPMQKANMKDHMVDYSPTDPGGAGLACMEGLNIMNDIKDCMGGQGLFAEGREYIKILRSILLNDERLLKKTSVDNMFQRHLSEAAQTSLQQAVDSEEGQKHFGSSLLAGKRRDWGIGGILVMDRVPALVGERTMMWGGALNSIWFIDRENGLCGIGLPQLRLPGNPGVSLDMKNLYLKGIYDTFNDWKAGV